jgi:uncharacterized ubiquitin-like protein YukD
MNIDKAIIIFNIVDRDISVDLEVPLSITANELVVALNSAYDLNIDVSNMNNCYLKAEKPMMLLRGSKTLKEFGVRNGTRINFTE